MSLDLATFHELLLPKGQAALAAAMAAAPTEATFLRCFQQLVQTCDAAVAKAALEQAMLRAKAAAKFSRAESMYFTRDALEQATPEAVANYRADQLGGMRTVFEACCGIGGDTRALAARGQVIAVDADPLRVAMARENVRVYECLDNATFHHGQLESFELPAAGAFVFDPDRRATGRRSVHLSDCRPALAVLDRWRYSAGVVKLAPAVPAQELNGLDAGIEFISLGGELKECAAWFGDLRGLARRATVLPGPHTMAADRPAPRRPASLPKQFLYDPDPAVTRAGLVSDLAERIDAAPLDSSTAFLTGDTLAATPFARVYRVEASLPFHAGRLRELLRTRGVGTVQIRKRGSAVDAGELIKKLKLKGHLPRTVVLTPVLGRPFAIVADRVSLP